MATFRKMIMLAIVACVVTVFNPVRAYTSQSLLAATVTTKFVTLPVEPTATPTPKVEYTLPYPGILPDHPLYVLKNLRDNILEALIVDPARKAEFYLLMADKQLSTSITLVAMSKTTLLPQAIAKEVEYMNKAEKALASVKKTGATVSVATVEKMGTSVQKHLEVLQGFVEESAMSAQKDLFTNAVAQFNTLKDKLSTYTR